MSVTPQYQTSIDQSKFVEPLKSSARPDVIIDQYFPESNYSTSIDSVLHKFLKSIFGEAGVGALRKNVYQARAVLEEMGLQNNQLEKFYANPLRFSRNIGSTPFSENYSEDPLGILTVDQWKAIQAKDQAYRNRAIDFLHAARLGPTPDGIKMAAKSAAGYEFDIVETYIHMFDQHSDNVLNIDDYRIDNGNQIYDSSQFTLIPNQEVSRTLTKIIKFKNANLIVGGSITINFGSSSVNVDFNTVETDFDPIGITALDIYLALINFPTVGNGNVKVTGTLEDGFQIKMFNNYSDQFEKTFSVDSKLLYKTNLSERNVTALAYPTDNILIYETWSQQPFHETSFVSQYDAKLIDAAVNHIKPLDSYGGYASGQSIYENHDIQNVAASSSYYEIVRHVTGNEAIKWSVTTDGNWIESGVENQAPRTQDDLRQHYQGFHVPVKTIAYGDNAILDTNYLLNFDNNYTSQKNGELNAGFVKVFDTVSYLKGNISSLPDQSLANFSEPINITSNSDKYGFNLINYSYIQSDQTQEIIQKVNRFPGATYFWASDEDTVGSEYLEFDLGQPKAVNFVAFEIFKSPVDIEISYDLIGIGDKRSFTSVAPEKDFYFQSSLDFERSGSNLPWKYLSYNFTDLYGTISFTRYIRIKFTRRHGDKDIFIPKTSAGALQPWPILVKNLRLGRNV